MVERAVVQVVSEIVGTVVSVAGRGSELAAGETVCVVESMKMEHHVLAPTDGVVVAAMVVPGGAVRAGTILCDLRPGAFAPQLDAEAPTTASPRLVELEDRVARLDDAARPDAVETRHARGLRTARENVADLVDEGSLVEYGRFAYAAQTSRRSVEDLIARTPADGLVAGTATVDGHPVAVLSYDAMVLAGTQGQRNHQKKDRLFELVHRQRLPVVFFTEGGGGRPGDTDVPVVTGLHTEAFARFAALRGVAPTIGIAAGRCFAGNAALLGMCDVTVAVEGASIGMGGPAMIEGGGLGLVAADDVGPVAVHDAAGSIDCVVASEADAVVLARRLLHLAAGGVPTGAVERDEALRGALPSDRRRAYDVRGLLGQLVDDGSLVELRRGFGGAVVAGLATLRGRAIALVASNPAVGAGAIDRDAATKAADHLRLAERWGLPVVSLVDTPGFLVGQTAEASGLVRAAGDLFVAGASLTVPMVAIVTRRGYGLGAQALCGGSTVRPLATVAWPDAELGGMGLEGAVRLGFRTELAAIADEAERLATEQHLIAAAYEHGRALNVAAHLEIDDVVDPADTAVRIDAVLSRSPARLR